ncbi:MAG: hypothetical protein IKT14_02165 [Clostridiales bacterium]|nr:hypothetical protein [Clostridiales bacterium]MBR6483799.1 hypothetical protein [Clostridiales bacterium]
MENGTSKKASSLKIITAAALVLTYVAVLYLAVNPKVSNEYRLYYIDKTSRRWPGQSGYDIKVGEPVIFNSENDNYKKVDRGRGDVTEEGVGIESDLAVIYLDSIPAGDYDVTFTFAPSDIKDIIDIRVTGCEDEEEFFADPSYDTVVTIPISLEDAPEDNVIQIIISSDSYEEILLKEVTVDEA